MEPFRPWVDSIAYQLYQKNANISITKEVKMPFLDLIGENINQWQDADHLPQYFWQSLPE
jgi:hypothetical protein